MKTAIICDWLVTLGGAEKVLQQEIDRSANDRIVSGMMDAL